MLDSQNNIVDEIKISDFVNIIRRRKRIVATSTGFCFIFIILAIGYLRIFKPTYNASFKLLISDPIQKNDSSRGTSLNIPGIESSFLNDISSSNSGSYTLIAFLKSYSVLEPLAKKYKVPYEKINSSLTITPAKINNKDADGIIDVNLFWRNKKIAKNLIEDLSSTYLKTSLLYKKDGLKEELDRAKSLYLPTSNYLKNIERRIEYTNKNLDKQLENEENNFQNISQILSWKIINPPLVNPKPVKPSISKSLSIGIIFSLFFGLVAGIIKDRYINAFYEPYEAEKYLKLNLLENIPNSESIENLFKDGFDLSKFFERSLFKEIKNPNFKEAINSYANKITNFKIQNKTLAFATTSALNNQFQFIINLFLARVLSEQGLKVLIVDCNLRNKDCYKNKINAEIGFSEIIKNPKIDFTDAITTFENYPYLNFISSGKNNYDDINFLSSQNFDELKLKLNNSKLFDLIIYQSPPSLDIVDIFYIAKSLDGLILYSSLKYTNKSSELKFVNKLNSSDINLMGLVTTSIKSDNYYSNLEIENNYIFSRILIYLKLNKNKFFKSFYKWINQH